MKRNAMIISLALTLCALVARWRWPRASSIGLPSTRIC